MKKILFLLLAFYSISLIAQKTIRGKVVTTKGLPLVGASVYINSTSIGTTTNDEGEFELVIKNGKYDLIASYIGFNTAQYSLDTETINQPIVFKLNPKSNMLDEVVVSNKKNKMSAEDRAYFLAQFKNTFLGKTNLSKQCRILNEGVIDLDYDIATRILEASVSEPIIIEHKGLGYKIYYDLVHFELEPKKVTYLGYTRYEKLKGSKRKKRRWSKKRKIAYNGSMMHFLKSVIQGNLKEQGFIVDQFKRVPNPDRPHDSIIRKARRLLRNLPKKANKEQNFTLFSTKDLNVESNRNEVIDRMKKNPNVKLSEVALERLKKTPMTVTLNDDGTFHAETKIDSNTSRDSLSNIVSKWRLKRFIDVNIKEDLAMNDFTTKTGKNISLSFRNYLKVTYTKEPEEDAYRPGPAKLDYQVSTMVLYVSSSLIDPSGILINPLDVFLEGYWSYEKTGDALPLDYTPD